MLRAMAKSLVLAAMLATTFTATAADKDTRVFEMRTYHAAAGKLDELNTRFRDHTVALFTKHGITNIGYWVPIENADNKLVYVLAYPSREARETSWKEFMGDPDWKAAQAASEVNGKLVDKVEQRFMTATDFSPAVAPSVGKGRSRVLRAAHLHHDTRQSSHPARAVPRSYDRPLHQAWDDQSLRTGSSRPTNPARIIRWSICSPMPAPMPRRRHSMPSAPIPIGSPRRRPAKTKAVVR